MSATAVMLPARDRARRRLTVPLVITAASVVAALVLAYLGSNVWASIQQDRLVRRFEAAATGWAKLDPAARSTVTFRQGDPAARLAIPSIGLDAVVLEGATPAVMRRAPGHIPSSATPGEDGVAIVTANRFAFGSFFLRLDRIAVGDRIVTDSLFGRTTYTVTDVSLVPAEQLDLATDSPQKVLILFGAERLIGGSQRLVVRAVAGEEA